MNAITNTAQAGSRNATAVYDAGGQKPVLRVQGLASANPFDRRDPTAPANRRISIVVMTREAEEGIFRATPEPTADSAEPPPNPAATPQQPTAAANSSPAPALR